MRRIRKEGKKGLRKTQLQQRKPAARRSRTPLQGMWRAAPFAVCMVQVDIGKRPSKF